MAELIAWGVGGLAFAVVWAIFALRPFFRSHPSGAGFWTFGLIQVSLVASLLISTRGDEFGAFVGLLVPPVALFVLADLPSAFMARAWPFALIGAGLAMLLVIMVRRLRPMGILLIAFGAAAGFTSLGDRLSQTAMCTAAQTEGLRDVARNTLGWSVMNTGREFQFETHALASRDDDFYAWSYGEMAWYRLPDTIAGNVDTGSRRCPA
ncbi:MAG: hypothetical protein AAF376_06355 [Pseudomonadota bacterium]